MKVSRIAASLVAVLGFGISFASSAQTVLKIGTTNTIDSHYGRGIVAFNDEIVKRTNGRYKLQYFTSGSIGGEREMLEAVLFASANGSLMAIDPAETDRLLPPGQESDKPLSNPHE